MKKLILSLSAGFLLLVGGVIVNNNQSNSHVKNIAAGGGEREPSILSIKVPKAA
ncbi:hypothetical protein ABEP00_08705 [Heyndrickxia sporothermodurans]|uniref:hypothetical protein n=1 Tax=Heyndrickxia sporothermodurans TaxID=46224 RepID=UPI0015E7E0FF|nr:hypothetical protein [Heyndrickxia sporothermodurans]